MTETETAWVAGLLEGEGCFSVSQSGRCQIVATSTDRDVLDKLKATTGMGNIYGPYEPKSHSPLSKKEFWRFAIQHRDRVRDLCVAIKPHMCGRRGEKIDTMLGVLG